MKITGRLLRARLGNLLKSKKVTISGGLFQVIFIQKTWEREGNKNQKKKLSVEGIKIREWEAKDSKYNKLMNKSWCAYVNLKLYSKWWETSANRLPPLAAQLYSQNLFHHIYIYFLDIFSFLWLLISNTQNMLQLLHFLIFTYILKKGKIWKYF